MLNPDYVAGKEFTFNGVNFFPGDVFSTQNVENHLLKLLVKSRFIREVEEPKDFLFDPSTHKIRKRGKYHQIFEGETALGTVSKEVADLLAEADELIEVPHSEIQWAL